MFKKKWIVCILAAAVLLQLWTPKVHATTEVAYLAENGEAQTVIDPVQVIVETNTIGSIGNTTWYYVDGTVANPANTLTVLGDVHLILKNGSNLARASVVVHASNSLTIYANSTYTSPSDGNQMGELVAISTAGEQAGIGGSGASCGAITINGGNIYAQGGANGAGIGSGGGHDQGGKITINGGKVFAFGGLYAPGIGGRYSGGEIEINGGTVEARGGGYGGAGIGSGQQQQPTSPDSWINGGAVQITGGTVKATGSGGGAGIGGGGAADGNGLVLGAGGGTVEITGGTVEATGDGGGAGIGGGAGAGSAPGGAGAAVSISGGTVTATGGTSAAADIGGGAGGAGSGSGGSLLVNDGASLILMDKGSNADSPSFKNCNVSGTGAGELSGTYNNAGGKQLADADWTVAPVPAFSYTGGEIRPEPQVYYKGSPLEKDTDFTYTYSNNINVGTASIRIDLTGGKAGSRTITFQIYSVSSDWDAPASDITNGTVRIGKTAVPYRMNRDTGVLTVSFSTASLNGMEATEDNTVTLDLEKFADISALELEFPPHWFEAHADTRLVLRSAIGGISINGGGLAQIFPDGDATGTLILKKGSLFLSSKQRGKDILWKDGAAALIYLPYTPPAGADPNAVAVYNKDTGKIIPGSFYLDGRAYAPVMGSGRYDVKIATPGFTDINGHWAQTDIVYAAAHDLILGVTDTAFAPNDAMTRGMLVTVLGRLSGADVSTYTDNSFTDVPEEQYYAPYIEWAYQKGIVRGSGDGKFAPDRAVTREEIAVIFSNYATATGHTLPVTQETADYADADGIGDAYRAAVTAMRQAGIMMGDQNNRFNPKAAASRAAVSAMLHRYILLAATAAATQK